MHGISIELHRWGELRRDVLTVVAQGPLVPWCDAVLALARARGDDDLALRVLPMLRHVAAPAERLAALWRAIQVLGTDCSPRLRALLLQLVSTAPYDRRAPALQAHCLSALTGDDEQRTADAADWATGLTDADLLWRLIAKGTLPPRRAARCLAACACNGLFRLLLPFDLGRRLEIGDVLDRRACALRDPSEALAWALREVYTPLMAARQRTERLMQALLVHGRPPATDEETRFLDVELQADYAPPFSYLGSWRAWDEDAAILLRELEAQRSMAHLAAVFAQQASALGRQLLSRHHALTEQLRAVWQRLQAGGEPCAPPATSATACAPEARALAIALADIPREQRLACDGAWMEHRLRLRTDEPKSLVADLAAPETWLASLLLETQLDRLPTVCPLGGADASDVALALVSVIAETGEVQPFDLAALLAELPQPWLTRLTHWARHEPHRLAAIVGAAWRPVSVTLQTGGATAAAWADLTHLCLDLDAAETSSRRALLGSVGTLDTPRLVGGDLPRELATQLVSPTQLALIRGRTVVFALPAGFTAVKLLRAGEDPAALTREAMAMRTKHGRSHSLVPLPLGVLPAGTTLAPSLREAVVAQGIELDGSHQALVSLSPSRELWTYVNEAGDEARRHGLHSAARDLVEWLAQGEVFTALTVKNHARMLEGPRRYEWVVDLCHPLADRRGMGRLDCFPEAMRFANVRATGIADLAELRPLTDVVDEARLRLGRVHHTFDPVPPLGGASYDRATRAFRLRALGDYLLDLSLLLADAYRLSGRLRLHEGEPTEQTHGLVDELTALWAVFSAQWLGESEECSADRLRAWVDFERMALQLAYFLEPANYAAELDATLTPASHDGMRVRDPASARDVEARLMQRLYGGETTLHIDVSVPHRSKAKWYAPGAGPVAGFALDGENFDLGPFNGPWPLTELERSLHLVSGFLAAFGAA